MWLFLFFILVYRQRRQCRDLPRHLYFFIDTSSLAPIEKLKIQCTLDDFFVVSLWEYLIWGLNILFSHLQCHNIFSLFETCLSSFSVLWLSSYETENPSGKWKYKIAKIETLKKIIYTQHPSSAIFHYESSYFFFFQFRYLFRSQILSNTCDVNEITTIACEQVVIEWKNIAC